MDSSRLINEESKVEGEATIIMDEQTQRTNLTQRDSTLRGHFRQLSFKAYQKTTKCIARFVDLALLHSTKLSLFILFFVSSTTGATVFNTILFLLFLILSTVSQEKANIFWKAAILVNSMIIMSIYAAEVVELDQAKYQTALEVIGIGFERGYRKYLPYITLLIVTVFTFQIISSEKFTMLKTDEARKKDVLTNFIYKYSIYLIVAALFVDIALMPINALNLILLYLMSRIVLKYFAFDD